MKFANIWKNRRTPIVDTNPIDDRVKIEVDGITINGNKYTFDEFNALCAKIRRGGGA